MDEASKKPRKARTVKNGIIKTDDVDIEPGDNYENWLQPVRSKLLERELKLMAMRLKICSQINQQSVAQFTAENKRFFLELNGKTTIQVDRMDRVNAEMCAQRLHSAALESVMKGCGDVMAQMLDERHHTASATRMSDLVDQDMTFRKYFSICKNWFDQIKLDRMAFDFWIPLFDLIQMYAKESAARFFCGRFEDIQSSYANYLRLLMMEGLINGKLKPPNSREMLLIPAGVFVKFRKDVSVLKIPDDGISTLKSRTGSKRVRQIILQSVMATKDAARSQFQNTLLALHEEVDTFGSSASKVVPMDFAMDFALDPVQSAENGLRPLQSFQPLSADLLPQFPIALPPTFTVSPPSDSASDSTQSLCSDPQCCRCSQSQCTVAENAPFDFVPNPVSNVVSKQGYASSTFRFQPSQAVRYGPY